jgi:hypothetical protein
VLLVAVLTSLRVEYASLDECRICVHMALKNRDL